MDYPDIIRNLPEAFVPVQGVEAHLLQGRKNQVVFFNFPQDTLIPMHQHGAQWGIVVDGHIELTIGNSKQVYRKGDSYYIPSGILHGGMAFKGFKAIDFFDEADRYNEE